MALENSVEKSWFITLFCLLLHNRVHSTYVLDFFPWNTTVFKISNIRQFQNEFVKLSFLPKYEQRDVKISALTTQGKNPDNFLFVFWDDDDFINSFWNCLTFTNTQFPIWAVHHMLLPFTEDQSRISNFEPMRLLWRKNKNKQANLNQIGIRYNTYC